jgi:hypothetical protein
VTGWHVTASLPSLAATVMFGVEADDHINAGVLAIQRLSWFPPPWGLAEITVVPVRDATAT